MRVDANEPGQVLCEKLTIEEEVDFLQDVNDAVDRGEISAEDAQQMIDRQYELQAMCA